MSQLRINLYRIHKLATQIGSSPYEGWNSLSENGRVRLLERMGLGPNLAKLEWGQLPSREKTCIKKYLEGESSSLQYDSPLKFAPDIIPTSKFNDQITGGYV